MPDLKSAIRAEIDARTTKQREALQKATMRQRAIAILEDRILTRAINDPERKTGLPSPDEITTQAENLVTALLDRAIKLQQSDDQLNAHDAMVKAAEQLEQEPAKKKAAKEEAAPAPAH